MTIRAFCVTYRYVRDVETNRGSLFGCCEFKLQQNVVLDYYDYKVLYGFSMNFPEHMWPCRGRHRGIFFHTDVMKHGNKTQMSVNIYTY